MAFPFAAAVPFIQPAIQGATNIYQGLRPSAEEKRLRRIRERGQFTPEEEARLLGQIGRTVQGEAARRKAGLRGQLASGGLSRSIAGQRLLNQPGRQAQQQLGEAGERLALSEAMAKTQAAGEYALAKDRRRGQLVQGIGSLAGSAIGAFLTVQQQQAIEQKAATDQNFRRQLDILAALLAVPQPNEEQQEQMDELLTQLIQQGMGQSQSGLNQGPPVPRPPIETMR